VTQVDVGCPVLRSGQVCRQRPMQARIVVTAIGTGSEVATVVSGSDGRFRIPLSPGRYGLVGHNLTGAPVPAAMSIQVRIRPGEWKQVALNFDSGVRGPSGP
jgi:hypothetical protein